MTPGEGARLQALLRSPPITRVIGVSDGLSALLAAKSEFEAVWASGLGISASRGVPDASILTMSEFQDAAEVIVRASRAPVIADCDTGYGDANVLAALVRSSESAGVAAVCLEDKRFPKRNSFSAGQRLADIHDFAARLALAKAARAGGDLLVIARLESLVVGAGCDDALQRARCYVGCGADAVLVHSKATNASEVLEFVGRWRALDGETSVLVIPTTYPQVREADLAAAGVSGVIYANQALRAAIRAMKDVISAIAAQGTAAGVEDQIAPIAEVLDTIGMGRIESLDACYQELVADLRALSPALSAEAADKARDHS